MRQLMLVVLALAGLSVGSLSAQRLSPSAFLTRGATIDAPGASTRLAIRTFPRDEASSARMAAGGVVGALAGMFVGGVAGAWLTKNDCEDCGFAGLVYGAFLGGSATLPLGVHLANDRRGKFVPELLGSLVIGGVGLAMIGKTNSAKVVLAVPVAQIASSILLERKTGK